MRSLIIAFMMLSFPANAAVRLADADPRPGEESHIYDNRITLTFGEAVKPLDITVVDAQGRTVSTGKIEGTDHDVEVLMKAPDVTGYICGTMTVAWHVKVIVDGREERGIYSFIVLPHFGLICAHQYRQ